MPVTPKVVKIRLLGRTTDTKCPKPVISPGSLSGMQKASNRVMDTIVTINSEQMEKNK